MKTIASVLSFILLAGISNWAHAQEDPPIPEEVQAKLIQKKSFNKAGKELPGAGDYYLVIGSDELFVKLSDSGVTQDELTPMLDQKITYTIIRKDGLWDTDDPNVQSRVGPYVSIMTMQ